VPIYEGAQKGKNQRTRVCIRRNGYAGCPIEFRAKEQSEMAQRGIKKALARDNPPNHKKLR